MIRTGTIIFGLALALFPPAGFAKMTPEQAAALPAPASHPIQFATEIKPILEASCIKCHGKGRDKGDFKIDTRETILNGGESGPAVVPGKSGESYFIELVAGVDPDNVMPRKGKKLSETEIGLLRAWIDQGLPWDNSITFARSAPRNLIPRPPEVPRVKKKADNPVDAFLQAYFETNKIKMPRTVDDRVFARRVYLDIVGLLPTPAEMKVFLSDHRKDKRARLAEKLLADNQRYAENWLTFWNDLLRNDYKGTGYIDGGRKQITPWLFSALATNMPYDRFVARLIDPTPESEGFAKGIVWRGVVNASQTPPMQAAQNISQVFMGVNLKCASCHDSFINDWQLSDAYGLANIYSAEPLEMFLCDKPTGKQAPLKFIYSELGEMRATTNRQERLENLAGLVTSRKDGRLSRTIVNRLWARFFGRGLVESVDDMEQPSWNPDLLDWLAEDLVAHNYDIRKTMLRMVTSQAYQMPSVNAGELAERNYLFTGPQVRRMTAEQFRDALGLLTGVWYDKPAAVIPARTNFVRAALVPADPLMVALGRPNREQVMTTRASAATTLQALELTNGGTLTKLIQRGAERMTAKAPASNRELIDGLYLQALGRAPSRAERKLAGEMMGQPLKEEGVEDFLWAMTMLPEFQLIY